jgi:hypothetical protein
MPYQCKRCGSRIVKHACNRGSMHVSAAPSVSFSFHPLAVLQREVGQQKEKPTIDVDVCGRKRLLEESSERLHIGARVIAEPVAMSSFPHWKASAQTHEVATIAITCKNCGGAGARMTHGYRWSESGQRCVRMPGELLCEQCRRALCDELAEYIPAPPGRPGCYHIARTRHEKRVSIAQGVTLLWVGGRYAEAKALRDTGHATVCRSRVA